MQTTEEGGALSPYLYPAKYAGMRAYAIGISPVIRIGGTTEVPTALNSFCLSWLRSDNSLNQV
jgi:hypothetical protein